MQPCSLLQTLAPYRLLSTHSKPSSALPPHPIPPSPTSRSHFSGSLSPKVAPRDGLPRLTSSFCSSLSLRTSTCQCPSTHASRSLLRVVTPSHSFLPCVPPSAGSGFQQPLLGPITWPPTEPFPDPSSSSPSHSPSPTPPNSVHSSACSSSLALFSPTHIYLRSGRAGPGPAAPAPPTPRPARPRQIQSSHARHLWRRWSPRGSLLHCFACPSPRRPAHHSEWGNPGQAPPLSWPQSPR